MGVKHSGARVTWHKDFETTCTVCGKRMRRMVLWVCVEDNEALCEGRTVTHTHTHKPAQQPSEA